MACGEDFNQRNGHTMECVCVCVMHDARCAQSEPCKRCVPAGGEEACPTGGDEPTAAAALRSEREAGTASAGEALADAATGSGASVGATAGAGCVAKCKSAGGGGRIDVETAITAGDGAGAKWLGAGNPTRSSCETRGVEGGAESTGVGDRDSAI